MFLKISGFISTTLDIALNYDVTESTCIKIPRYPQHVEVRQNLGRRQVCTAISERLLSLTIKWPTMQETPDICSVLSM